jgi:hypothetical protein
MNETFQIIINTSLLRELSKSKLLTYYGRFYYVDNEDLTNEEKIRSNLLDLLDWDTNGDSGLELFCSRFESIKRSDLKELVKFILNNTDEIIKRSKKEFKLRELEHQKVIRTHFEILEDKRKKHFCDENYEVNPYGKPAKETIYEGRRYKSRQECMYKEGLTKAQLYKYLKKHETNKNN